MAAVVGISKAAPDVALRDLKAAAQFGGRLSDVEVDVDPALVGLGDHQAKIGNALPHGRDELIVGLALHVQAFRLRLGRRFRAFRHGVRPLIMLRGVDHSLMIASEASP